MESAAPTIEIDPIYLLLIAAAMINGSN